MLRQKTSIGIKNEDGKVENSPKFGEFFKFGEFLSWVVSKFFEFASFANNSKNLES